VPEVANHLNSQSALRIHNVKKWLYGSAVAGILGLTLLVAGYKELLLSNYQYTYFSPGVVHADEPSDVYEAFNVWLASKVRAGEMDEAERAKRMAEIQSRMKVDFLTLHEHRGDAFIEKVPGGSRIYNLRNNSYEVQPANRAMMLAGLLLAFVCLFGFIVEWRLRQLKRG
jgi:hypothetical protein